MSLDPDPWDIVVSAAYLAAVLMILAGALLCL